MAKKVIVKNQNPKKVLKAATSEKTVSKSMELVLWKKLLLGLIGIIALIVACVVAQPDQYVVERSITINAPVAKIFTQVNDFHNWANWSPFEKIDPTMQTTFTDQPLGQGAVCRWTGNDQVGAGSMIITESEKNVHVTVRFDFLKPKEVSVESVFYFTPQNKDTLVKWHVMGKNKFWDKLSLLLNPGRMDKVFGADLQTGLAGLKAATE